MVVEVLVTLLEKAGWKPASTKNIENLAMLPPVVHLSTHWNRTWLQTFSEEVEVETIQSDVDLIIANQTIELLTEFWRVQVQDTFTNKLIPEWFLHSCISIVQSKSTHAELRYAVLRLLQIDDSWLFGHSSCNSTICLKWKSYVTCSSLQKLKT